MQGKTEWAEVWFVGHYWVELLRVCMRFLKSELSSMIVPVLSAFVSLLALVPPHVAHEPLLFQSALALLESIQALLQCIYFLPSCPR